MQKFDLPNTIIRWKALEHKRVCAYIKIGIKSHNFSIVVNAEFVVGGIRIIQMFVCLFQNKILISLSKMIILLYWIGGGKVVPATSELGEKNFVTGKD